MGLAHLSSFAAPVPPTNKLKARLGIGMIRNTNARVLEEITESEGAETGIKKDMLGLWMGPRSLLYWPDHLCPGQTETLATPLTRSYLELGSAPDLVVPYGLSHRQSSIDRKNEGIVE